MNILFICNQNQHRSKTAEHLFRKTYRVKSAGLYNTHPLSKKQLQWADTVVVMEDEQRTELSKRFPSEYLNKRILSMNIPDIYSYNQPELVKKLKEKLKLSLKI